MQKIKYACKEFIIVSFEQYVRVGLFCTSYNGNSFMKVTFYLEMKCVSVVGNRLLHVPH